MDKPYITVGWHKGEVDFRVSAEVSSLSYDKMQEIRAMIPVAIAQLENLFLRGVEERNPAAQAASSP